MRLATALLAGASLTVALASPAAAETVQVGAASATTVGIWVYPMGCSQLPVEYAGIPAGSYAYIRILDSATRNDIGSKTVYPGDPQSARANIQVCKHSVDGATSILLSLDIIGVGAADSATFGWASLSRCVNRKTYEISLVQSATCPKGSVKR